MPSTEGLQPGIRYSALRTCPQRIDPCPAKHLEQQSEGQSDHVGVAAVDGVDEHAFHSLRGVRAGFVERLAGADVLCNIVYGQREDADF